MSRLLRNAGLQAEETEDGPTTRRSPMLWFTAEHAVPDTQFGVYRSLFVDYDIKTRNEPVGGWRSSLQNLQVYPEVPKLSKKLAAHQPPYQVPAHPVTDPQSRMWLLLMVGGGHFAGMVVSLVPKLSRGQGGKLEQEVVVLAHKTFHRYTSTRSYGSRMRTPLKVLICSSSKARWSSICK